MIDLKQDELDEAFHHGCFVTTEVVNPTIWDFFTHERFPKLTARELKKARNELIELLGDKMSDAEENHLGEERFQAVLKGPSRGKLPNV
jgi:hypothetical protein